MSRAANDEAGRIERENERLRGDLMTVAKRFSHDLRTPLGGIISSAEAIKDALTQHDPTAVPLVEALLRSADEMGQLIKQVSFVARASASPLPKTPVHMAEPVFVALQRLESRILKHRAVVKEPPSWPVVPGVAAWLEMVWWHLVLNALKHGGQNCHIELGWTAQRDHFRFWVRDNGPGVPEMLRGKLFKEFNALHAEQNVPGFGLSIVQRLVELQAGNCGHEQPGPGGAIFFFTLPVDGTLPPEASNQNPGTGV